MSTKVKGNIKVAPQKAVEILKKHGTHVTEKEAEIILDFMYKIGKLSMDQYVNNFEGADSNVKLKKV